MINSNLIPHANSKNAHTFYLSFVYIIELLVSMNGRWPAVAYYNGLTKQVMKVICFQNRFPQNLSTKHCSLYKQL